MRKMSIVAVLVCVLLTSCNNKNASETIALMEPASSNYETAVVIKDELFSLKQYPAYVTAYTQELCFSEEGIVDMIMVTSGEEVKKGQILATLNESNLEKQINELEATIKSTKENNDFKNTSAQYDIEIMKLEHEKLMDDYNATSDSATKKELKLSDHIKLADINLTEVQLDQAKELQEYELAKLKKDLDALYDQKQNTSIKAPFSGTIVYIAGFIPDDFIDADRPVIVIADSTKRFLKCEFISEDKIEKCSKYYAIHDNQELELSYVPIDIHQYVKSVLTNGEPMTSFRINEADDSFPIGTYMSVIIINNDKPDVLVVPSNAVYLDTEGNYVYLIDQDTKLRRSVEVGVTTGNSTEIVDGLEEGDVVYVKD